MKPTITASGPEQPNQLTRLIAALIVLMGLTAVMTSSSPLPAGSTGYVEELSFSMVELLADDAGSGTVWINELTNDVLQDGRFGDSDGEGVDVALIDSGIAPVDGLDAPGKVLHGPDLSSEGGIVEVAYLDTYGHGTHMAGLIAGERADANGVAPGARLVSLKVAGADGATTIAQVIAAIDWVVEHRDEAGLNIRVLNLSLGVGGVSTHHGDLLSAAVERAWEAGIFVVVAAGNDGESQKHLDSPAIDPYVLAVGAADSSTGELRENQPVPVWSAMGDGQRNPDLVTPGRSLASYRVPGSTVDLAVPDARRGDGMFVGSGTSQAAAVISGLAARLIGANPDLDPDDVKASFMRGAEVLTSGGPERGGDGRVDFGDPYFDAQDQKYRRATRGTEIRKAGDAWNGGEWTRVTWDGATWSGAVWTGATWSGAVWSGAKWSGATWSGATWSGATWSGATWSGATWSGATWSGATWTGATWS